ncbi:pectin lyase-like protein [Colletotrichum falcatum]|nr:pectin lyase-like protein [Colletotrichum falcatum]
MALALQKLLLFFIVGFLYATPSVAAHSHNHRSHGKIHRLVEEHHAKRNASLLAGNGTAAEIMIARFQEAMAVANQAILESPKHNVAQVQNSTTRQRKRTKAQPLDYHTGDFEQHANGTVFRRAANGSTPTRESYTVPSEVADAARVLAEANPLPPTDYDALLARVRAKMAKRKAHLNDTNVMPQKTKRPSGLVEYVPPAELAITVQNGTKVAGPDHPDDPRVGDADAGLAKRAAATSFWMETMTQRGSAPYAPAGYKVWRNVRDYGAYGDGVHDDTAAINLAISDGGRCGAGCPASTRFPATVYFPAGTYLVSSSIIQFYNTEMLGDPLSPPVILAAASFSGLGVITSDVYVDDDVTWYLNQNNFLRSVRNFVIDIRPTPQWAYVCAIHWQVAQGTSLENIAFISTTPAEYDGTTQQGIYMENGSGGFMSDLVFVGGNFGAYFGNQQFTTSGLLFDSCRTGLQIHWDWGWTMQDTEFYNCGKGVVIVGGAGGPLSTGQGVGSLSLVDVHMWGVPVAVETSLFADNSTALHIDNGGFQNCATIVLESQSGAVLYPGDAAGLTNVLSWGFGKVADPGGETGFVNGADMAAPDAYPPSLLVKDDIHPRAKFFHRTRPSYADPGSSQIFDVKALGARGDGATDDTAVLNRILDVAANVSGIVYFPHGIYIIRDTLEVPVGSRIIGQAWPQIMATGARFEDMANPRAAVRVGAAGSVGVMEIQCVMFTVRGPTAGAVLVEWNVHESSQGSAGLWDSHMRVGGAEGSHLQNAECPKTAQNKNCVAASMMMHMTEKSSGYLENVWMWVADHDMEDADQIQISVYAARGVLIESRGPTWLWGTAAEHAVLYQYQLSGARNVVMGLIQTEAPYFQSSPKAPAPFEKGLVFRDDPTFADCPDGSKTCAMAWSLRMVDSANIYVISGGLYTWFQDYSQDCVNSGANDCQLSTFYVEQSFDVWVYNLITIGAIQMVTPLNGQPVSAANNRNGFASSIVTWLGGANQTAGGRNMTGYTLYTRDDLAGYGFSEQCKTALTGTIACVDQTMQWTSPGYRGSLGNATLQDEVCDVGCRASLASWYQGVSSSCADYAWSSGAPLEMAGGYIWYGYNESCQAETGTGRYCNDVIDEFGETETLDDMPDGELCSDCFSARVRMMQQSTYSVFNTVPWYQTALEAIRARCSVQGSTDVPPPLIVVPTPDPFCVSDKHYTIRAGDTCNSIALANDVSSANVFYAAAAAGATRGCGDLPADLTICLPLTCETYLLRATDDCFSASAAVGIEDIALYNSWIDDGCDNLHEANATLGSVVCVSPLGGTYIPGAATNTSGIPGGGAANYSSVAVRPPAGATVAPKTATDHCGLWYVARQGDTCGYITMTYSVGLSLLARMNPSIDTKTSGGCSSSVVPGYAYCMSPVLLGPVWADEGSMTLDACAKACSTDGYSLAGLKGPEMCLCGDQVSINSIRLSASACTAGPDQGLSLYGLSDDAKLTFQFVDAGCFANSALVTGSGPSAAWATNNTVGGCASFCLPAYPYFGVTNGDTCRCGTGVDAAATALDTDANCNVVCTGRANMNCGGSAATHIYAARAAPLPRPDVPSSFASSVTSATPTSAV